MAITGIAHVCVKARNLSETVGFYEKLGFKPIFKFVRGGKDYGMYVEIAEGQYLEFFEEPDSSAYPNAALAHFCLETDDIEAAARDMDAKGIAHTPVKLGPDKTYQLWLTDPNGLSFELHQYTKESAQTAGPGVIEADW